MTSGFSSLASPRTHLEAPRTDIDSCRGRDEVAPEQLAQGGLVLRMELQLGGPRFGRDVDHLGGHIVGRTGRCLVVLQVLPLVMMWGHIVVMIMVMPLGRLGGQEVIDDIGFDRSRLPLGLKVFVVNGIGLGERWVQRRLLATALRGTGHEDQLGTRRIVDWVDGYGHCHRNGHPLHILG